MRIGASFGKCAAQHSVLESACAAVAHPTTMRAERSVFQPEALSQSRTR
jgi:hypothetical protein